MSKIKECFTSDEIAHIWAHGKFPRGRVSGGSMSFEGWAFKSYLTTIATRITHKGKSAFVLDWASFSLTTSKAQGALRNAVAGLGQSFTVHFGRRCQSMDLTAPDLVNHYLNQYRAECEPSKYEFQRAENFLARAAKLEKAIEAAKFFGLAKAAMIKERAKIEPQIIEARTICHAREAWLNKARQKRDATERANDVARAIRLISQDLSGMECLPCVSENLLESRPDLIEKMRSEHARRNAVKIEEWLADKGSILPDGCPVMLRKWHGVSTHTQDTGWIVETSLGARIPLKDAERAFRFAIARRSKGWHRNGEQCPVGSYELDAINEHGIVAGCHRIAWPEVERFARAQGWIKDMATAV